MSRQIVRTQHSADLRREQSQKVVGGRSANFLTDGFELVRPQQGQTTHATGGRFGEALGAQTQQMTTQPQSGGRVAAHGIRQFGGQLTIIALVRRNNQLYAGFAFELASCQHQL